MGKRSGEDESEEDDKSPQAKAVLHHPGLVDATECGTSKNNAGKITHAYRKHHAHSVQVALAPPMCKYIAYVCSWWYYTAFSALGAFLLQVTSYA